jgi:glutaredoxin-related protein
MIIYGTDLCKDCIQCKKDLDGAGILYEYRDISANLMFLKEFLEIRDTCALFEEVKRNGYIGIPTLLADDGTATLDWESLM